MANMFPILMEPGFQKSRFILYASGGPCTHTSTVRVPLGLGVWIYRCWGLTGRLFGQTVLQNRSTIKHYEVATRAKYRSSVALEL